MARTNTLPLVALLLLALAGCGNPGALAPAPETPQATPLTSQTASPSSQPTVEAPGPTPINTSKPDTVEQGWEEVTVDDWVSLEIPQGWGVEQDPNNPEADFIIDQRGNRQVWLLYGTEGQYAADYCDPAPAEFTVLETTPVEAAGAGAVFAATVTPVTTGDPSDIQQKWQFEAGLTTPELITPGECFSAFYALYPEKDGYIGIKIQEDPMYALRFDTEKAAEDYQETEEFEILSRIITSAEILV